MNMPITGQAPSYSEAKEAFRRLWESKNLPLEARRYVCGAIQQAGVRQGDEVYPREFFEQMLNGKSLHPEQQMEMFERVHKFVLVDNRLRKQYLYIIVHMLTKHLTQNYSHILDEVKGRADAKAGQGEKEATLGTSTSRVSGTSQEGDRQESSLGDDNGDVTQNSS